MTVTIALQVGGIPVGEISGIPFIAGVNVQQAMEAAFNLHVDSGYSFSLQYFGNPLGYEVVTLDGIANQVGTDPNSFMFWALYVNAKLSPTGIDETILNDGDLVIWNYQS